MAKQRRSNPVRALLQRERADRYHMRKSWPWSDPPCPAIYLEPAQLPVYAWPGGYSIIYLNRGNNVLCAECATRALNQDIGTPDRNRSDVPIDFDTYDEGPDMFCDGCNAILQSSYGDPDADDSPSEAPDDND